MSAHRVRWWVMVLGVGMAWATSPLAGQSVAIDTAAMRQLAGVWAGQPGDSLACLHGYAESDVLVIDSVSTLAFACGPGLGAIGFVHGDYLESDVLATVLEARKDWTFIGVVHGVVPVFLPDRKSVV